MNGKQKQNRGNTSKSCSVVESLIAEKMQCMMLHHGHIVSAWELNTEYKKDLFVRDVFVDQGEIFYEAG